MPRLAAAPTSANSLANSLAASESPAATNASTALLQAARSLAKACDAMHFGAPVTHVYNPLRYAWQAHECYLRKFASGPRRVIFLGMNPGPFGMMQIGVPFGEIAAVRDWMHITAPIDRPAHEHPRRPIEGFACTRSEVSGRRLWGWVAQRFGAAEAFFSQCLVLNYCPLVFLEASGRNYTPEKLPVAESGPLQAACDTHLARALEVLQPEWAIGIGGFATKRLQNVLGTDAAGPRIAQILHPSPASPAANRGWDAAVNRTIDELGVFPRRTT